MGFLSGTLLEELAQRILFFSVVAFIILCLWSLYSYSLLRNIPGPFLAAFTNLPRVSWILSDKAHDIHIDQHEKYGKLVRFGPNMVSVGDATEIPAIYSFKGNFGKVCIMETENVENILIMGPTVGLLPRAALLCKRKTGTNYLCNPRRQSTSGIEEANYVHLFHEQLGIF